MSIDIRAGAARFYDATHASYPNDIEFYRNLIPSRRASVLELGCGTGRVLVPLVRSCQFILGIDHSEAMLKICREKLSAAAIGPDRAVAEAGDICDISPDRKFDLITAPYRVIQNLETDAQIEGLMNCIRRSLSAGGTCVLNVFNPVKDKQALRREWCHEGEVFRWEMEVEGGRVMHYEHDRHMDRDRLILYPELIYRRYEGNRLAEETVLKIPMRCWYPGEFEALITAHGFRVLRKWGGYAGEAYGSGPELVIQFELAHRAGSHV